MKPQINDQKCGASETACKAMEVCPMEAISYIEVDEPRLRMQLWLRLRRRFGQLRRKPIRADCG